jgi:hypothetical protein
MPYPHSYDKQDVVKAVMHKYKKGSLKSGGSEKEVRDRKQAIAIALSEGKKYGQK